MKKFKLKMMAVFIMAVCFTVKTNAQVQPGGLYLTYNDYSNHKLCYPVTTKGDKIITHDFLEGSIITVISNGERHDFAKNQVFGFRDNNKNYRLQDNKAYLLTDTTGFCIYLYDRMAPAVKGLKPVTTAYFSAQCNGPILALSQENIDKAFAANYKFRTMVQAEFKNDNELNQYDDAVKQYKIKELYSESSR